MQIRNPAVSTYRFTRVAFFLAINFAFTNLAFSAPLIIGIAPSLPEPIAELEVLDDKPSKKQKILNRKLSGNAEPKPEPKALIREILPTKEQAWQRIFSYIETESGLELQFEPATSQLDFELKLAKGYYDLAYITPLQFNAFRDFPGYQAQIKRKSQPLRGIVFVKKNGPITTLADLRGSTIAFPGLLNFSGSIIPRESLQKLNFEIIPQFLPNANSVYAEVANGQYVAGGGTEESFHAQPAEIKNRLRMIWDSPGFSPHALVAHPRVPFFTLVKLKRALVGMNKDDESKKLLKHIFVDNGFEAARGADWDEIKSIDLNRLNGAPESTQAPEPKLGL